MFSGNFLKFVGAFLAIILTVGGGFFVWDRYFSEMGRLGREQEAQLKLYNEKEKAYIEAMTADTYGGKTPQETLDMFVDALRKEDIELASKYFLLDENLSREKWIIRLHEINKKQLTEKMAADLQRAVVDSDGSLYDGDFGFVIYKDDGIIGAHIDMEFNKYSKVWKIESI